jgi:hypothetical protein
MVQEVQGACGKHWAVAELAKDKTHSTKVVAVIIVLDPETWYWAEG